MLIRHELPEQEDPRFDVAADAWARRLARAVHAGLLTEDRARAAWRRKGGRRVVA